MINNDSVITAYDEHLTLVEWLQKVEKLLANGGLKSTALNDKGNATFSLTLTFNDNTTITSPDMTLTSVNEALTTLTGDVSRIDGSIKQLNTNMQGLINDVANLEKFKFVDPSNIPPCVFVIEDNTDFDIDNLRLSWNYDNDSSITQEVGEVIKHAIKQGFIKVSRSNNIDWVLLPLITAFYIEGQLYACFGGKDLNDYGGYSYYISIDYAAHEIKASGYQL